MNSRSGNHRFRVVTGPYHLYYIVQIKSVCQQEKKALKLNLVQKKARLSLKIEILVVFALAPSNRDNAIFMTKISVRF